MLLQLRDKYLTARNLHQQLAAEPDRTKASKEVCGWLALAYAEVVRDLQEALDKQSIASPGSKTLDTDEEDD